MDPTTLWTLPVPSTTLLSGGPQFEKRAGRSAAIYFSFEADDCARRTVTCAFHDVAAFRCTYDQAREDWMLDAYDRLIDRGETSWREEVAGRLRHRGASDIALMHLAIYFDDGPCYEVICNGFKID